ncbi:MAG: glycoside hydrolase family 99-like domain-containing protein [Endomicrobium sp.]|nr:glycoside hydrolase family 99-like domain-containing protein [Endomicrobium sp.]
MIRIFSKKIERYKTIVKILGIEVYKTKTAEDIITYYFLGLPLYKKRISLSIKHSQCLQKEKDDFLDYVLNQFKDKSKFVPLTEKPYTRRADDVKLIAFYLPQFYHFAINDEWHGKGFTEWTNVTKALPQFIGHEQPQLPIDVGFYSLETTSAMRRQIELAKMYGIYGWCFYYYWFSGKRIMEKPLLNFLNDKSLDMPFCLFWANENWTRNWGEPDVVAEKQLYEARVKEGDAEKFMQDALPLMKDSRYIKIENKPVLIIYQLHDDEYDIFKLFIKEIRRIACRNGFDGLYLIKVRDAKSSSQIQQFQFDAAVEFPPYYMQGEIYDSNIKVINQAYRSRIVDINRYCAEKQYLDKVSYPLMRGCFTTWDNTSRKYNSDCWSLVLQNAPLYYKQWLSDLIEWTKQNNREPEQFVFINAWNEWAEGAHLEPDHRYGYAYLQATKEAIEQ